MSYQEVLKDQLSRRQAMNSKYSLRSFARKLGLSPSKVSEILNGKKRLSVQRAHELADRLSLSGKDKEYFIASAQLEATTGLEQKELAQQLKALAQEINAGRTAQRNAWYFSAVKALVEAGLDSASISEKLGITELQTENAKRFIKRIQRFHPERQDFSIEPVSLLKKIEEEYCANLDPNLEVECLFLSEEDQKELKRQIKALIRSYRTKKQNPCTEQLSLVHWGMINLTK